MTMAPIRAEYVGSQKLDREWNCFPSNYTWVHARPKSTLLAWSCSYGICCWSKKWAIWVSLALHVVVQKKRCFAANTTLDAAASCVQLSACVLHRAYKQPRGLLIVSLYMYAKITKLAKLVRAVVALKRFLSCMRARMRC